MLVPPRTQMLRNTAVGESPVARAPSCRKDGGFFVVSASSLTLARFSSVPRQPHRRVAEADRKGAIDFPFVAVDTLPWQMPRTRAGEQAEQTRWATLF